MHRHGRDRLPLAAQQLPPHEIPDGRLHGALRQPRLRGDVLMRGAHAADAARVEIQIDDEGRRHLVVADQIRHQRIHDVVVDEHYSNKHYSDNEDR